MSDYAKLNLAVRYSENSDYSNPEFPPFLDAYELTPDEYVSQKLDIGTSEVTYDLGQFTTITGIIIQNLDSTNFLEAEYFSIRGSQAADDLAFANANPDTIADNNTSGTFITNGAESGGYVRVASSENSGENDGAFLISQAVDGDNLTLAPAEALTANTNDTAATLSFERKNKEKIPAGGFLVTTGNIQPAGDLKLLADTASVNIKLIIFGT